MNKPWWVTNRLTDGRNRALISEDGKTVHIELTQGLVAHIDTDDWPLVRHRRWCGHIQNDLGQAHTVAPDHKSDLMHRIILGVKAGDKKTVIRLETGHMNFRRANLRLIDGRHTNGSGSRKQTKATSKYIGVCRQRRVHLDGSYYYFWEARVCANGYQRYLGCFPYTEYGERAAALAYDDEARLIQAPDRTLNEPEIGERGIDGKIRTE